MSKLTKIQESARGELCTVMVDDNCLGFLPDTTTTILAHKTNTVYSNSPRRCDARSAYTCVYCHDVLDGRTSYDWKLYEKEAVWGEAIERTHVKLIEKGLLTFEGIEPELPKVLPRRKM